MKREYRRERASSRSRWRIQCPNAASLGLRPRHPTNRKIFSQCVEGKNGHSSSAPDKWFKLTLSMSSLTAPRVMWEIRLIPNGVVSRNLEPIRMHAAPIALNKIKYYKLIQNNYKKTYLKPVSVWIHKEITRTLVNHSTVCIYVQLFMNKFQKLCFDFKSTLDDKQFFKIFLKWSTVKCSIKTPGAWTFMWF